MKKPFIPSEFELGAKTYTIAIVSEGAEDMDDCLGLERSYLSKIYLLDKWKGTKLPKDTMEDTLFHEVFHCILEDIGRNDLSEDEGFVQSVANLFRQFIKTMK